MTRRSSSRWPPDPSAVFARRCSVSRRAMCRVNTRSRRSSSAGHAGCRSARCTCTTRRAACSCCPTPASGILRGVSGLDEAVAVAGVTGVTMAVPVGESVTPLPEGDRYLGFIFARGDAAGDVEARSAHRAVAASRGYRGEPARRIECGTAPWRNRTSLNRLKAGCSSDELRGRAPGLYCRPCLTPYHRRS